MFTTRPTSTDDGRGPAESNGGANATQWYEIVESYGGLTGCVARARRKAFSTDSHDESTQIQVAATGR